MKGEAVGTEVLSGEEIEEHEVKLEHQRMSKEGWRNQENDHEKQNLSGQTPEWQEVSHSREQGQEKLHEWLG